MLPRTCRLLATKLRFSAISNCEMKLASRMNMSSFNHISLSKSNKTDVSVIKLNRPPVNSLSLELMAEFCEALEKLENDGTRGVIITSALPNIFSAGLDLSELYQAKRERLERFWKAFQDLWIKLYSMSLITIAAINGHSPAAGCILAISCDYRIMLRGNYRIGITSALIGLATPPWIQDTMLRTVGFRETEMCLQLGQVYSPERALEIGLIDDLCGPEESDLMKRAEEEMTRWLQIPEHARQLTKEQLRRPIVDKLIFNGENDLETFVNVIIKDSVQKTIGEHMQNMRKDK